MQFQVTGKVLVANQLYQIVQNGQEWLEIVLDCSGNIGNAE
jgi:hypothetical protein